MISSITSRVLLSSSKSVGNIIQRTAEKYSASTLSSLRSSNGNYSTSSHRSMLNIISKSKLDSSSVINTSVSNSYFNRYFFTNSNVLFKNKNDDTNQNVKVVDNENTSSRKGRVDKEMAFYAEEDPNIQPVYNSQGIKVDPQYYIEFTCTYKGPQMEEECGYRSKKTFSKHAYHKGVVIIKCEGCKQLHLIADHLGWTGYEGGKTIEEWMEEKGVPIQRYMVEQDKSEDSKDEGGVSKSLGGGSSTSSGDSKQ